MDAIFRISFKIHITKKDQKISRIIFSFRKFLLCKWKIETTPGCKGAYPDNILRLTVMSSVNRFSKKPLILLRSPWVGDLMVTWCASVLRYWGHARPDWPMLGWTSADLWPQHRRPAPASPVKLKWPFTMMRCWVWNDESYLLETKRLKSMFMLIYGHLTKDHLDCYLS